MTPSAPPADQGFGTLFTFLPIGAYRCAPDGTMLHANPALVRLNGFATEADFLADVNRLAGDWYLDPGRRQHFQQQLAMHGQVRGLVSAVQQHGTGLKRWVSENAHLVRDAQGQPLYYEGTVEDITEQVHSREALQRSEEQMRQVASQVPGMVFAVHIAPDGRRQYRFVSDGVRDIYGFEPGDLLRDPDLIRRYRHPADQDQLERDIDLMRRGHEDLGGEFRIVRPDGQIRWILRRSTSVSSDETGVLRVGVLLDITEQREAEVALRETEARWKLALESAGDGVWDWNLATGEEYLSASMLAMYGFNEDELPRLAEALDQRTHPEDREQMLRDRLDHFEGRTPIYRNEHRVQCKGGAWKWVLTRGMVISRDVGGKPLRMVGTHTDITELKEAEMRRQQLEGQLRESQKMEAIGTLAGGVAHDFNNLLAAILGNLSLAREDVGDGHLAQESLAEIQRAALRARQLVQQILAFSRRQSPTMEQQALGPLVEEALNLMRSLLPAGVRLNTRMPVTGPMVRADSTQIQQVVMNLCTNAWQAMRGRGGEITVSLKTCDVAQEESLSTGGRLAPGRYACLSVADSGQGIAPEHLHRIFEPFYTTKPAGEGTGLGLSVVHGIVTAHQGGIDVHSQLGEGTRFDLYFPVAGGTDAPAQGATMVEAVIPQADTCANRHIVYVDDYEAMLFLASRMLGKQGYRVTTFLSGELALAWLAANGDRVDLLVTDQNMPGLSGIDVAREVAQIRPGLRVAIMSGYVSDELREQARLCGVHEVLAKQDRVDDLVEAVRSLLPAD
ncbi:PAS domain-containing protein [Hydrogenophaga sp.]|uniref:hybrid sensor histidine kinase/response regulator n=1 Tax=Hydrogenophaga sp. TaxID=1904254 RepID=UPI0035B24313